MLEHGLSDLSLRPLAAALGTSGRMLIYYFGSKDQLIVDILNEVRRRKEADIEAADEERGLRAYWDWAMSPPGIRYLRLVYEVYGLSQHEPERFAALERYAEIDRVQATGLAMELRDRSRAAQPRRCLAR